MAEVTASVDDHGAVTWSRPPTIQTARAEVYAAAAFEAEATLPRASAAYTLALRAAGAAPEAAELADSYFYDAWIAIDARAIGADAANSKGDREQVRAIVVEVDKRNPTEALRGRVAAELSRKGYPRQRANALAAEAVPDSTKDRKATEQPIQPAADWIRTRNAPDDAELAGDAPGLLYSGRTALLHARRGMGKSTVAAWGAAVASVSGHKVLLLVDDDERSWAKRLQGFGAVLDNLSVAGMRAMHAPGALESAMRDRDVLFVDSWRRYALASGTATAPGALNDEAVVGPLVDRLVDVARAGAAVCILANEAKSSDTARGSFSLEDAVDVVRSVKVEAGVSVIETAGKCRHGIPEGPFRVRLRHDGSGFDPDDGGGFGLDTDEGDGFGRDVERTRAYLMKHRDSDGKLMTWGKFRKLHARPMVGLVGQDTKIKRIYDAAKAAKEQPVPHVAPLPPEQVEQPVPLTPVPPNRHRGGTGGTACSGTPVPPCSTPIVEQGGVEQVKGCSAGSRNGTASTPSTGGPMHVCEFEGCTEKGSPRAVVDLSEPAERQSWNMCDEHWAAWAAETTEVPSEPAPTGSCLRDPSEFRAWLARVQWRPPTEAEVAAERARLMGEQAATIH